MPIHSHDCAERLKPEWIAQARQKRGGTVVVDNCFGNRGAQAGHPLGQPVRHAAAMQRKVGKSRAFHAWDYISGKAWKASDRNSRVDGQSPVFVILSNRCFPFVAGSVPLPVAATPAPCE